MSSTERMALSDFLMPGYLCAEKQVTAKHARPILDSREAKSPSEDQEAGVLAMETSHNQTLSFISGGVKENVLSDLPRQIIQDHYCELPPLQVQLYEDVTRSKVQRKKRDHYNMEAMCKESLEMTATKKVVLMCSGKAKTVLGCFGTQGIPEE